MAKARTSVSAGALRPATVVAVVLAGVYSWIAAGFLPFTWPMRIAVIVPVLVAGIFALGPSRPGAEPAADQRRTYRSVRHRVGGAARARDRVGAARAVLLTP